MLHQTFLFLGQVWQSFEVSQILEFYSKQNWHQKVQSVEQYKQIGHE